jgi:hypothetical protein
MYYLTITALSLLLFSPTWAFAQNTVDKASKPKAPATAAKTDPAQKDEAKQVCQTSELTVVGKNEGKEAKDFLIKMGESLVIKATGECAAKIIKDRATKATLYLDGVQMSSLTPTLLQTGPELNIAFDLTRDANNDDNRKAWDTFLKKQKGYLMTIQPAIAVGNDLPKVVQSKQPLKFYIAPSYAIFLTLIIGLAILIIVYILLVRYTSMLCDEGTGYYSLGKSQMAFWGLMILLAFTGIWILTGTVERIPSQALILLGISGATGLGAILIGNGKKAEIQNKITKLREEEQALQDKQAQNSQSITTADKSRLAAIPKEMGALTKQLGPGDPKSFWRDICDDGNGASFHRLQIVIWTIVLGAVFVRSVADVISMPEFSDTLLTLMGISSGTYLGFKIPEK